MSQALKLSLDASAPEHEVNTVAEELTRTLNKINSRSNEYRSEGEGVGWRNVNGETIVTLEDGHDLLRKITPDGPCNMDFEITDESILVTLSHHDSPTGETHRITAPEN